MRQANIDTEMLPVFLAGINDQEAASRTALALGPWGLGVLGPGLEAGGVQSGTSNLYWVEQQGMLWIDDALYFLLLYLYGHLRCSKY